MARQVTAGHLWGYRPFRRSSAACRPGRTGPTRESAAGRWARFSVELEPADRLARLWVGRPDPYPLPGPEPPGAAGRASFQAQVAAESVVRGPRGRRSRARCVRGGLGGTSWSGPRRGLTIVAELARRPADHEPVPREGLVGSWRGRRRRHGGRSGGGSGTRRGARALCGRTFGLTSTGDARSWSRSTAAVRERRRLGSSSTRNGGRGLAYAVSGGPGPALEIGAWPVVARRRGGGCVRPELPCGLAPGVARFGRHVGLAGRPFGCCCLFRLHRPAQAVAVCLPTDAVGLSVLDGRRVALYADPQLKAEIERFFVRQSQLAGKLVDADLLRQLALRSSLRDAPRALQEPRASPNPRTPATSA